MVFRPIGIRPGRVAQVQPAIEGTQQRNLVSPFPPSRISVRSISCYWRVWISLTARRNGAVWFGDESHRPSVNQSFRASDDLPSGPRHSSPICGTSLVNRSPSWVPFSARRKPSSPVAHPPDRAPRSDSIHTRPHVPVPRSAERIFTIVATLSTTPYR